MKKVLLTLVLCLLFCCVLAAGGAEESRTMTVMVYMTGSDLESISGAATNDMVEMLRSGLDPSEVNVVLFTGGSTKWKSGFPSNQNGLYTIDGGRRPTEVELFDLMNMGDPATLTFFLRTCGEKYPADHLMLIFWNHGAGPLQGVCVDRLFDNDLLTLEEIDTALRESGIAEEKKLWLMGFDACLMGSLELAAVCEPYAEYMVASQELEPGKGWNYAFLKGIEADVSGAETGRRIIDTYFDGASAEVNRGTPVTLACTDLSRISALSDSLDTFFSGLADTLEESSFAVYSRSREDSASVARSSGNEYDLVDLRDLLSHYDALGRGDASSALAALDDAIVASRSNVEGLHGLSIYFPYHNKDRYTTPWGERYPFVAFTDGYARWVERFGAILTGAALTSWDDIQTMEDASDASLFTLQLSPDQLSHYASASLLVLEYDPIQGAYFFANQYPDVTLSGEGMLSARLDDVSLFAVDANGEPLSASLFFSEIDGFYVINAVLTRDATQYEDFIKNVTLRLRQNPDNELLEIVDAIAMTNDNYAGRVDVDLSQWVTIEFVRSSRFENRDAQGRLLPYFQWIGSPMIEISEVKIEDLHGFRFLPGTDTAYRRFASFQVRDTQDNAFLSELIPVTNRNLQVSEATHIIVDTPEMLVTLREIQENRTSVERGVTLFYDIQNHMDTEADYTVTHLSVNGIALPGVLRNNQAAPGATVSSGFTISAEALQQAGVSHLSQIRFDFRVTLNRDLSDVILCTADCDVDIDLSDIIPVPDQAPMPVVSAESEGLKLELLSASVLENGSPVFDVHLINGSDHTLEVNTLTCTVNGYIVPSAYMRNVYCRAGEEWYGELELPTVESTGNDAWLKMDAFLAYGIRTIENMMLWVDDIPLEIVFPEPFDYGKVRGGLPSPLSVFSLWKDEFLALDLAGISVRADAVLLNLLVHNQSDQTMTYGREFSYQAHLYHGTEVMDADLSSTFTGLWKIPAGLTSRVTMKLTPASGESPLPLTAFAFSFPYALEEKYNATSRIGIRFDQPVTSPAEQVESYRLYEVSDPAPLGQVFEENVPVPEGDSSFWVTAELTAAQMANLEHVQLSIGRLNDGDLQLLSVQRGEALDDRRIGARISGLLLAPQSIPDFILYTADTFSESSASHDVRGILLDSRLEESWIRVSLTIVQDLLTGGASVTRCEPVEGSPPFPKYREDLSSVMLFPVFLTLPEGTAVERPDGESQLDLPLLPSIANLPSAGRSYNDGKEIRLPEEPLSLFFRPMTPEDNLVALFTIYTQDGQDYSLPLQPIMVPARNSTSAVFLRRHHPHHDVIHRIII